jgi:hypothetical protein
MGAYPIPIDPTGQPLSLFYQVLYYAGTGAGVAFFMWAMQTWILPEVMPEILAWMAKRRERKRD